MIQCGYSTINYKQIKSKKICIKLEPPAIMFSQRQETDQKVFKLRRITFDVRLKAYCASRMTEQISNDRVVKSNKLTVN